MANSRVQITEGAGKSAATYSFTEDSVTKEIQRVALNEQDGTDVELAGKIGALTETAPASDTASSGLNGRLQRIAQRLSSLIALLPTALTGGGNFKVAVQEAMPQGKSATATFTPAAALHVGGDTNGAAAEFALAAPSGCVFLITDAEIEIDGATAETSAWRLYLYNVTPPSAYADDAVWDLPSGDRASYLGFIDLGVAADLGSTQWTQVPGVNRAVKLSGTSVFGYLVNLSTQTPANVAHIVRLTGAPL